MWFVSCICCIFWLENSIKLVFTNCHPCLGAISALGPPGKPPQLDDSYSPYNLMSTSESPTSPLVPPDSWGQGKSPSEKISNGTNINWPPGKDIVTTMKYLIKCLVSRCFHWCCHIVKAVDSPKTVLLTLLAYCWWTGFTVSVISCK